MADLVLVGNILDDSSGADSEDSVQDITNETEYLATPKSTRPTSAASTITSGSISTPSTTDIDST